MPTTDANNSDLNQQNKKRTRKSKVPQKNVGSKSTKNTRRNRQIDSSEQNLLPAQIPKSEGFQIIDYHSYQKQLSKLIMRIPLSLLNQQSFKKTISARIQSNQVQILIQKDKQDNIACTIRLKLIKQSKQITQVKQSKQITQVKQKVISIQVSEDEAEQLTVIINIWGKYVYISGFQIMNKTIKKSRKQVNHSQYNQISKIKIKEAASDLFICLDLKAEQYVTDEYNGLINQGNTCYMNSYLQMLYHIPAFRNLVYQAQIKDQNKFPATLQDLFYKLTNSDKAVSPQSLVKSFGWGKKQAHIQQDAQQFSCLFFQALQKKLINSAPQKGYKNMTIEDLFKGQLTHYIRCTDVNFRRQNYQQFIDLQIPVSNSLQDSLLQYTCEVHLSGDNKYYTDDYGLQQAFKGVLISTFPPILMIQLKRFHYSFQLQRNVKILDKFVYPQFFNFNQWNQNGSNQQYQLYGVLVHEGSKAESGHYYNYLKISNLWYKFNDQIVQQVPHQKVFNYNFGGPAQTIEFDAHQMKVNPVQTESRSTAYMLVYIKKQFKSIIFDAKPEYSPWLIKKDENKVYAQQQKKNRKFFFHDINLINWNDLKGQQCQIFGFLTPLFVTQHKKQTIKIDKRLLISDWLDLYTKTQTNKNQEMISEKQIQMIKIKEKQQNISGLYAYYVTPERQTLCGYFNKSHHSMENLLKNLNQPTLIIAPVQANKSQYFVVIKKFQILKIKQNNIDFHLDDFLIINKQTTSAQLLKILRNKYQGLQKMQLQNQNKQKQNNRQSYNFFIQDYKTGLIKLRQTNYFLPSQGSNKNQLLLLIAECSNSQKEEQLTFEKWYQNKKDIINVLLKNQKTEQIQQLKGISGSTSTNELRNIIFQTVLKKDPQYESAEHILIKYKSKKTSKIYSEVINDLPLRQLVKYDQSILYSHSVLCVQSRLNQTQIIFYYRFKSYKFSDPLKIIVKKGQSQAKVVQKLRHHEKIVQYLNQQGFQNSILLLFTKDKYTINDLIDSQGRIIGKGDLQTVLKRQKNAVLTIQGFQKMVSQKLTNEAVDEGQNVSLLIHHVSKTGQKIGNPVYMYLSKNIQLIELKQKVMDLIMNQNYQWENKIIPCNVFKLKMILYGKDSKKAIDISQIQENNQEKPIQKPFTQEGSNQLQENPKALVQKNNSNQQKQQSQIVQIHQEDKQSIIQKGEESNVQILEKQIQNQKKQQFKGPQTIFTIFPKTKQLKLSIIHSYLAKAIQPLKLNVE